MTVLETTNLSNQAILSLTDRQIRSLPTIVDVLEYISTIENQTVQEMLDIQIDFLKMNRQGYYQWVSDEAWTNIAKLIPLSPTPFLFMRGQNTYFEQCVPSLYRVPCCMTTAEYEKSAREQVEDFFRAYADHPVIRELRCNCKVEDMALAQHYGFPTEYLDITNNKWVAAFFASTRFDADTDGYYPVETGFGNGYGVLYLSRKDLDLLGREFLGKLYTLGFQYFARPSSQNAWVYRMERNENFDAHPAFMRIVFRHDTEASNMVYAYSMRQERYFPKDTLSELARAIRNTSEHPSDIVYPEEARNRELQEWETYGRENLRRHILPLMPVFKI